MAWYLVKNRGNFAFTFNCITNDTDVNHVKEEQTDHS